MLLAWLLLFTWLRGAGAVRPKEEANESDHSEGQISGSADHRPSHGGPSGETSSPDLNRFAVSPSGKFQRAGRAKRHPLGYELINAEVTLAARYSAASSVLMETAASQLHVLQAGESPLEERKDEIASLGVFWGAVWTVIIILYATTSLLSKSDRPDQFTRPFKVVAARFHRDPFASQLVCTAVLFGFADIFAQQTSSYHEVSNIKVDRFHGWDFRATLAVVAASCLFQAVILQHLYVVLDQQLGHPMTLGAAVIKSLQMTLAFCLLYLPFAVFLYAVTVGFTYRTLVDATDNCATSALVGIPGNFLGSLVTSGKLWTGDFLQAVVFWPPSHVVNYVLVQRWEPNLRPVWDGVVVLLWNVFVLGGGAQREAVGPMLFGPIPGPEGDKEWASVDCDKWSLTAIARWIKDGIVEMTGWIFRGIRDAIVWMWEKTKEGAHWLWEKFKEGMHWIGRQIRNSWHNFKLLLLWLRQHIAATLVWLFDFIIWLTVEVLWLATYLILLVLTVARVWLYWIFEIMKGLIKILFSIIDYTRAWMLVFFWAPRLSPLAEGCFYCGMWPGDGEWPHQLAGNAPNYTEWVRPFSPEKY
eukprot:gb/GFBE01012951.1/.p1 GENE.gb/GFBE01012951.1/~~gb/GFBE01012951.1/.p1  ORF type:complete len:585 (+),score=109.43 gb/GFBE01012951.1/:1-1755(+)